MAFIGARAIVILLLLGFVLFGPNGHTASPEQTRDIESAVASERASLQILRDSTPPDFDPVAADDRRWLNLTGFRQQDALAWHLLPHVKEKVKAQVLDVLGPDGVDLVDQRTDKILPLYRNVSSSLKGGWSRVPLGEESRFPPINLSIVAPDITYYSSKWGRNVTGSVGKLLVKLDEQENTDDGGKDEAQVSRVSAIMTFGDETAISAEEQVMLHGIHFKSYGGLVLTTTSEKFAGIFGLPHLTLSASMFNLSQTLLNQTLTKVIKDQEDDPDNASRNPWRSGPINEQGTAARPLCEMVVYLQEHKIGAQIVSNESNAVEKIKDLEHQLRHPDEIPLLMSAPDVEMSMLLYSPDCGYILESRGPPDVLPLEGIHLRGPKVEVFIANSKRIILGYIAILMIQLASLIRQIKTTTTPSTKSRISFYTLTLLLLGDACTWVVFLTVAFFLETFTLLFMVIAFLGFMQGGFFGMKFLMDVWTIQKSERNEWRNLAATEVRTVTVPPVDGMRQPEVQSLPGGLPLPVTAQRPSWALATPFLDPVATVAPNPTAANGTPPSFGSLYTRFYLLLLFIVFLSLHVASSWPPFFRSLYTNCLTFIYLSFWTPQIYKNIIRNCRRSFSWEYIVVQSMLRLAPIGYFWGVPSNFLDGETNLTMLSVLVVWVWCQILVIGAQEMLGPRFFIKDSWDWVPPAWDYHPVLRDDDEGGNIPVGYSTAPSSLEDECAGLLGESAHVDADRRTHRLYECAICMQQLDVPVAIPSHAETRVGTLTDTFGGGMLARRSYMITPCRHVFHTDCLESWLGFRLQCPICRENLPPL